MARVRRTSGPLDLRAQAILRAVIEEYVGTANPVSSQALVERYRLGVSSATVRNVLAELETAGLLTHPHTSAGRMPTDAGYRLYVESIVDLTPLPAVEQLMIRHQFGQVEFTSEHWFRLAATTLASVTRSAGLATPAKPRAARVRRIDVLGINERLASLIVVLREGSIKQQLVALDEPADGALLARVAERVNALANDLTADQLDRRLAGLGRAGATSDAAAPGSELVRLFATRVLRTLREYDQAAIEELFSDGLLNVMSAPEFADPEKLRRVWSALENRAYLADLFRRVAGGGDEVRVFIGRENRPEEMSDVSLVLAPYGQPGRAMGVVGVLGPTRMRYPHAMGTVRFVSTLMNELVEHLYA
ncbi:MAG TPA: heat-inducible transcriptional repressor HrcA [Candidatus Limnocylindrales bacterium]|nr:heat-inducible transcriptional repressor HrcA [Candidatus Limnocylindrales bacterium]